MDVDVDGGSATPPVSLSKQCEWCAMPFAPKESSPHDKFCTKNCFKLANADQASPAVGPIPKKQPVRRKNSLNGPLSTQPSTPQTSNSPGSTPAPSTSLIQCVGCQQPHAPNYPGKKYCTTNCYHKNRPKKNEESFSTPAGIITKGKRSHDTLSPATSLDFQEDVTKKKAKTDFEKVISDPELADLDRLAKADLTKKLEHLISFIHQQNETVLSLESKVEGLERDIVTMKLAFADNAISTYKERDTSGQKSQCVPAPAKTSYASAARGPACPVLIANFAEGAKPADRVSLTDVDKLLGAGLDGPVPQRVRQKDDKLFITLKNPDDYERAKDIIEKKPECSTMFKSVTKSNALYPAVALFVNLSYLPGMKEELMYRNDDLRDKVHSCELVYTKPGSNVGHVKILLTCRETRDNLLFCEGVDVFNSRPRVVEVDLNREVRRCFNCQGYGHGQKTCRLKTPKCGKCSGAHRTNTCKSKDKKCVHCYGQHHSGDKTCPAQVKAVARYRASIDRR